MYATSQKLAIQLISSGGYYGAERALIELAAYLKGAGWHSHVVALEGQGAGAIVQHALERGVSAEAFVPHGRLALRPLVGRLRALLRANPGAVLHSHGYKPDILLALLRARRDFACMATCHNWISETAKMRLLEALDKRALRGFDHVIAVSDGIAAELTGSGVPRESVTVIDNGISAVPVDSGARSALRAELALSDGEPLLLHVGRLARSKRVDLLLQVMAQLPAESNACLLLAGDGEERERLVNLARSLGIDGRVRFCGYRRDVERLLGAADVFVLCSEREGLPISILEAMSARCPIVATRVGAIPQVLEDGAEAWLVPANNPQRLRDALHEALSDPELARARAQRAFDKFTARYSQRVMGERYLRIYEAVLARRTTR